MRKLIFRFWPFGLAAALFHYLAFRVCRIFEWPPGNPLDWLDAPICQITNSIFLYLDPSHAWEMIPYYGDHPWGTGRWVAVHALLAFQWFLVGMAVPALLRYRKIPAPYKYELIRKKATVILTSILIINLGWHSYMWIHTYWGLWSRVPKSYVDCGTIEPARPPGSTPPGVMDVKEASSRSVFHQIREENIAKRDKFLAAYARHQDAKCLIRYENINEYLFLEFQAESCHLHVLMMIRPAGLRFCELDMRGWKDHRVQQIKSLEDLIEGSFRVVTSYDR